MAHFVAEFRKRVISSTGHETTIVQRTLEIDARDRQCAKQAALQQFCDLERVKDWKLHADDIVLAEADFPS